jgi:NAD(P)-dependent dehydrogenase (short-subunit alcohol dehydrogenase family)
MSRVLITGSNSGIGRSTAILLAAQGYEVFAGMRDIGKATKLLEGAAAAGAKLQPITLDVNDDASVRDAVAGLESDAGPVDILINNAGIAHNAAIEDVNIEVGKGVFETNFWGIIRCTQAVLPNMRAQGSGHVVNISSVAGRIAAIGQVVYSASKWAVEAMSENLAQEGAAFGIRVSIIEPGVTRTAILPKNMGHPEPTAYADTYRRMLQFYARGIMANTPAEEVARVIHGALEDSDPKLRYPCAWGGIELCEGRSQISDAAWTELGACKTDEEYFDAFEACFGLDIRTPAP